MSRIVSVNLAGPEPHPAQGAGKRPVDHLVAVRASGSDQAVYAYAREDYDWWQARLSRRLANGLFGEDLTTEGVDVSGAVIGERWRVGPRLVLQPTFGRIPSVAFQRQVGEPRWAKTFARANRPGAYLRVLEPGEVWAGDPVTVLDRPAHGVTIARAFRAYLTRPELLPELLQVDGLPDDLRNTLTRDGRRMVGRHDLAELLDEQAGFYRAVAAEYGDHALPLPGGEELAEALDAFRPAGSVLELACGPGTWTGQLLRHATDLTAVDASAEMLAIAAARVGGERVRFVRADLFGWRPDRRYDVVFFGFWLSHVPPERFAAFWSLVAECLQPGGRVFFVDDGYRTVEELVEGEDSPVVRRRLNDGTAFRIVKVPYRPEDLERRLDRLGWRIAVRSTAGPFYWGAGSRVRAPA